MVPGTQSDDVRRHTYAVFRAPTPTAAANGRSIRLNMAAESRVGSTPTDPTTQPNPRNTRRLVYLHKTSGAEGAKGSRKPQQQIRPSIKSSGFSPLPCVVRQPRPRTTPRRALTWAGLRFVAARGWTDRRCGRPPDECRCMHAQDSPAFPDDGDKDQPLPRPGRGTRPPVVNPVCPGKRKRGNETSEGA